MSKTPRNSESRDVRENHELMDDEIALVSGGGAVVQAGWNLAQNKKAA